jgi:dTDP-4-amino-4,6-dideoxygalactose transaminase
VNVPFVDLKAQYAALKPELEPAVLQVIEDCAFVGGKYVKEFEEAFAAYCGRELGLGVASGTSALHLALLAMGVGPGDEVITAANTFMATTEAITHSGARPVLVDVDPESYTMDPGKLEEAVTERTKVVIPVHLYGQTADMDPIMDIAGRRGLKVLEDSAQAQGAEYKGRKAGSMGDAAAFSFYPSKNLGAFGDAGIILTDDPAIADTVRMYANHGRVGGNDHAVEGFNARLDGVQGAVLGIKLRHLDEWNDARRAAAARYAGMLEGMDLVLPREMPYARHIYHVYGIRIKNRERVAALLKEQGVGVGMHYAIPVHLLSAYKYLGLDKGSFPVTEQLAEEELSLPMFPEITEEQQRYVADKLSETLETVA